MGYKRLKHQLQALCFFCSGKGLTALVLLLALTLNIMVPASALAFGSFTYKDEAELGRKFNVLVRSRLPIIQDPEITLYIESIVKRLSKGMPPQPFPFQPSVVRSNSVNAFATPGGYLFVFTGLILAMDNESELAGVMAHEMAHVTQRHIARRIENSQWISILSILGALAGAFMGGDAGQAAMAGSLAAGQSAMLNYSRADESEADQVGMNYLVGGSYNPHGMPDAFKVLSRRQWLLGSTIPAYLSTHPDLKERVSETTVRVQRLPQATQDIKNDNTKFKRVQSILRARYSDPEPSILFFNKEKNGPNKCIALMGLGIIASRQNRINDASAFFDEALQCDTKDQLIVREAGQFHYFKGNRKKGAELLQQAVNMNKNDVMALFFYARSLADTGNVQLAIDQLQHILRSVPEDSEVYYYLATYSGQLKDMFKANLYMAYSALYENNGQKVKQFIEKARGYANTESQRLMIERFDALHKERATYWK